MRYYNGRKLHKEMREKVLEEHNFICAYCQEPALEVDHITPHSYSHDDSPNNLVACCRLCNALASNKVFSCFNAKQTYLLKGRDKMLKKRVPVWTEDEFEELDPDLQAKLIGGIVVIPQSQKDQFLKLLKSKGIKYCF